MEFSKINTPGWQWGAGGAALKNAVSWPVPALDCPLPVTREKAPPQPRRAEEVTELTVQDTQKLRATGFGHGVLVFPTSRGPEAPSLCGRGHRASSLGPMS